MPKHELDLKLPRAVPVGNVDVEIPVRIDGKPFGTMKVSRGSVDWLPSPKSKAAHRLTWEAFAELIEAHGKKL